MLGLFGTLSLGTRSLQTQRTGIEIAGQNLANVNNSAYARQRVIIQSSVAVNSTVGPQGTGADVVAIQQIRNSLVDRQITSETSVGGYLDAQQSALQYAQASLGESLDRAGGTDSTNATGVSGGLADDLNNLFAAFQSAASSPTSLTERQLLTSKAQTLASQLNQTSTRLSDLHDSLNGSVTDDVASANKLISDIADLNDQVVNSELSGGGVANDLRDLRQSKLDELSKLVKVDASLASNGSMNLSIDGNSLVEDKNVVDTLQSYDAGGGQVLVRTTNSQVPLAAGGHIQGTIDVRDGALATLQTQLNTVAGTLITEVNAAHSGGFGLNGSSGAAFFTGTDAKTIAVNSALVDDPSQVQLSGTAGAAGNNTVGVALAQLADKKLPALNNQTLSQNYNATVAEVGQALSSVNGKMSDQDVVQKLLLSQRDSISGVSIDEEMTDMMKFQKAFEASAKLITTVDEMLDTLINMKR